MKFPELTSLRKSVKACSRCINPKGKSMVNIIAKGNKYAPKGIGYWSDAYPNYRAPLMIIGQDWGSVDYLDKFVRNNGGRIPEPYNEADNYTWENLIYCLERANISPSDIYLTNALLCLRYGHMSGNKGIDNKWFINCFPFLEKQIEIIEPKIIVTLGQKVFEVFARHYGIKDRSFKENACKSHKLPKGIILFPLYHTGHYGTMNRGGRDKAKGKRLMVNDFKRLKKLLNH